MTQNGVSETGGSRVGSSKREGSMEVRMVGDKGCLVGCTSF
jgi:hypothetical protein